MKKLALTLCVFLAFFSVASAAHYTYLNTVGSNKGTVSISGPTSGLVGYWTFNGQDTNWNTNTTKDLSGNNNTGTLVSMSTTTSPIGGVIGQALTFNGTSSYVSMATVPTFTGNIITESVWFNRKANKLNFQCIVSIGHSAANFGAYSICSMADGKIRAHAQENYVTSILSDKVISNNAWHHAVMVSNGTNYYLYIDGVLQSAVGTTGTPNANFFRIGLSTTIGTENFDGSIDDVRIFNRALTTAEITKLYNLGKAKAYFKGPAKTYFKI